ncbi:MAG: hypothetical protein ACRCSX_01595, partial [Allorhizobium sp.]
TRMENSSAVSTRQQFLEGEKRVGSAIKYSRHRIANIGQRNRRFTCSLQNSGLAPANKGRTDQIASGAIAFTARMLLPRACSEALEQNYHSPGPKTS